MTTQTSPRQTGAERDTYLAELLQRTTRAASDSLLDTLRDRAQALVKEQALPSTRDEEWRFTDLSPLLAIAFQPAAQATVTAEQLQPYFLEDVPQRLVFVDGFYAAELSQVDGLPQGVIVADWKTAQQSEVQPHLEQYLGQQQDGNEVFTALNTAGFPDAAVVWIPKNQEIETPIHVLYVASGERDRMAQPRALVVAGANSRVTLIEDYISLEDAAYLTNTVTEIWADANAQVDHIRLQRESVNAYHIGKTAISQARDSRYSGYAIALGAALSRHNWHVSQTGEQTDSNLYGLAVMQGQQLADTHSNIVYAKPHGTGNQLHKCILDDRSQAVFNGKIFVPHEAQLTNASQLNRNLLLSGKARVNTKPQLEIVADNVKCAHGATVSQLEADEVFYLQSRGIDRERAQRLLISAFAQEVLNLIPVPSLRDRVTQTVTERTT
jgi:Fe-S cluster assembly protein SufD